MNKPYVILFNSKFSATRKELQEYVDTIREIPFWYGCMSNNIFVVSALSAQEIYNKLAEKYGTTQGAYFMVQELNANNQGWMPKQVWHMLKNPDSPRLPKVD